MAKEVMVYQANPLIEGRRDFSLIEARIFYLGLRDVVPRLTNKVKAWGDKTYSDFPTTVISANELVQMFGNPKYYSTLKEICKDLSKKSVEIKGEEEGEYFYRPVFTELHYSKSKGLTLEFSPKMIPYLLDLADKPFTKLPFEQVWALRSTYAMRLFELLLQYQNTKTHERIMTIEELRHCLGVPDEAYKDSIENFRRRVIESSIKDINEKTAYKIECEKVKEGRKIVAFKFKLHLPAELKKEQRAKQIADIGKITKKLADKASLQTEEKPAISDEQRAKNQKNMKKLLETIGK
jgi:plasmid replication initiation protein